MNILMKSRRASVALVSVIIISAFTLILVIAMSEINISTSYQLLNSDANKLVYYNAESCLEEALVRLEKNTSFTNATLSFANASTCQISVSGDQTKTINIIVNYLDYTQNFEAQAIITQNGEANNIRLSNWKKK